MKRLRSLSFALILLLLVAGCTTGPEFQIQEANNQIHILADGEHFTSYISDPGLLKPVLYPVYSPSGIRVQRQYPLQTVEGESHDHPHHVGLFFTYGSDNEVNGNSYWNRHEPPPRIRHMRVTQEEAGMGKATLGILADWVGGDDDVLLQEDRTMVFTGSESERAIDFTFNMKAQDEDVNFEDTKEGMFAIRVADWLSEEHGTGMYLNSEGDTTSPNVWGKRAKWVRLEGEHEGTTVGIAILNHPSSVNYPTFWHARGYGLFSANPLGQSVFQETRGVENPQPLNYTIAAGDSAQFKFKMIIYEGHRTGDQIEDAFQDYSS